MTTDDVTMLKCYVVLVFTIFFAFDIFKLSWSTAVVDNDTIDSKILKQSEYCFVNDSIIIRKLDGTLLNVTNDGDWLVATDGIDFFVLPTNGSDCGDDVYKPNMVIYVVLTSVYCLMFLLATCTIALHLYFKELQTVFGILITMYCFVLNIDNTITFVHNRYQYTHKINDNAGVCAMFVYVRGTLAFFYHSIKFTVLFHFTYLMYNGYRMRSGGVRFDKKLMCKYLTFMISLTTIYVIVVLPYDLSVPRDAFKTRDGYCEVNFVDGTSVYIFIAQLTLILVVEVTTFCVGIVFYFLVSKRCCDFSSSDLRVSLTLVSTSGLNRILFLMPYVFIGSGGITFVTASIGTCTEQLVLLIIFLTSKKVKSTITSIVSSSS